MNLKQFLETNNCSAYAFAKLSGLHIQTILNIMKGIKPRLSTALKIEKATYGSVKIHDTYKKKIAP